MRLEPVAYTLAYISVTVVLLVFMTPELKREASEVCWRDRVIQRDGKPKVGPCLLSTGLWFSVLGSTCGRSRWR